MTEQDIFEALDAALRAGEDPRPIVGAFLNLIQEADDETKGFVLRDLERPLRSYPPDGLGPVAILAGACVELGGDPRAFPPAVFDRLVAHLETIRGPEDETEMPDWFYEFERAAMACLSRSPELRRTLPQKPAILAKLRRYQERYGFLGKMVQVLDNEPLVVVHPSTARGFRFTMHGIADNFQLHLLLLAALAGSGPNRIEGAAPSREAIDAGRDGDANTEESVRSSWQLANWLGLRAGGEIDREDYNRTWIWNEGVPADIVPFEGTRVVLIGPSTVQRSWNARRVFSGMPGRLDGPIPMAPSEVKALLEKIEAELASSRSGR